MGLAFSLGMASGSSPWSMATTFNMSVGVADKIFICASDFFPFARMSDITPEHIADLLDAYADRALLAKVEGKNDGKR